MLYAGLGDGGSGGDPLGNGQNFNSLLGSLLRLDVDHGDPYAIPADNPFVGQANHRGEVWAKGLRNPWRYAFDQPTGLLYIADVGQDAFEEVDVEPAASGGLNYGWNVTEGFACYNAPTCTRTGFTDPAIDYRTATVACSITGGYVYRGAADRRPAGPLPLLRLLRRLPQELQVFAAGPPWIRRTGQSPPALSPALERILVASCISSRETPSTRSCRRAEW